MAATRPSALTSPGSVQVPLKPILFTFFAFGLVAFWVFWLSAYVLHRTYRFAETSSSKVERLESIWSWLLLAGIGWGLLNLYWSIVALRRANLTPFLGHWLITIACGLIVVGIEGVMIARALTITPIVIDHSQLPDNRTTSGPAIETGRATIGNSEKGKSVFSKTCITCHGPTGQGMPNLAPSLVGSKFVGASDDVAVATVVRLGRAVGDPNNRSGKVMPARGGNPFLTEEDISNLVAFVRTIQSSPASDTADSTSKAQLSAWVVPVAKRPSPGVNRLHAILEDVAGLHRIEQVEHDRNVLMRSLTVLLTIVHGFFLMGVIAISSTVILPRLISQDALFDSRFIRLSTIGWTIAAGSWLMIAWLCFWWR